MDSVGRRIEKRALDIRFARKASGKRRFKDYVRERDRCDVVTSIVTWVVAALAKFRPSGCSRSLILKQYFDVRASIFPNL